MQITIHRGTNEIGGTCIQLSTDKTTILLDAGSPLSKNSKLIDISKIKTDAILISHPHQDHYGLLNTFNPSIPIYIGEVGKNLINATQMLLGKEFLSNNFYPVTKDSSFTIGDFKITPYLVDHSAVDAFGFSIQTENKNIFYSGDFRGHGRKAIVFEKFLANPPKDIDVLFMEGTMINRNNNEFPNEEAVEKKITETLKHQKNISFIISSSQNIDRIVAAYKACLRTGKTFIIDLYTAWILEQLKIISNNVPNMDWNNVKIFADHKQDVALKNNLSITGEFRKRAYIHRIKKEEISEMPSKYLYLTKMSKFKLIDQYKKADESKVNIIYSQWLGYLNKNNQEYYGSKEITAYQNDSKINFIYAHTSGHATIADLKRFAQALKPKKIIPIHTEYKNTFQKYFENVHTLDDNESLVI